MKTDIPLWSSRLRLGMRLFLALSSITMIFYILFTAVIVVRQQREIRESLIREGQSLAGICSESLRTAVFAEDRGMIETIVRGIIMQEGVVTVAVYNDSRKELFMWNKMRPDNRIAFPYSGDSPSMIETDSSFEFDRPVSIEVSSNDEEALYAHETRKIGKTVGYVRLVIDKAKLNAAMERVLFLNTAILFIFIVMIALATYFTVKRIATPFECRMTELEKMEAVGTLARGIAHDFNNILGAARGYLYILKKKLEGDDRSEYVAYTEGSLDRAQKLVESLLSFSHTDSRKFTLLDLNDLVKSLRRIAEPLAAGKFFYREALSEENLLIKGDRLQLEQVILNLIMNAFDAMGETGELTIKTEKIAIGRRDAAAFGLRAGGHFACVTVQDTGEGFDIAIKSKIFEPFFTTKEVGKGTGLGLAIAYGAVKEHNGFIDVDSVIGSGTSFKVYLPLASDMTKQESNGR